MWPIGTSSANSVESDIGYTSRIANVNQICMSKARSKAEVEFDFWGKICFECEILLYNHRPIIKSLNETSLHHDMMIVAYVQGQGHR